jgi:signal peptidase I
MLSNLFFRSDHSIKKAKQLLLATKKVIDYRKDVLHENDLAHLWALHRSLSSALKCRPTVDSGLVATLTNQLHTCLTEHGGTLYPVTFWSENAETFMVAAILALSVRAFFFQHYKIPTNSMYPTYAGMLPKVYALENPKLTFTQKAIDFLVSGATTYEISSPTTGVLSVPIFVETDRYSNLGRVRFEKVVGRKWFGLLPEVCRAYTLFIGNQPVTIKVPWDFCLDEVICKTFFPAAQSFEAVYFANMYQMNDNSLQKTMRFSTNHTLRAGSTLLNFQILTGDSLFVDRFTYHFRKPKVGEAFVFHTGKIPALSPQGPDQDEYYIKRIAGQG